MPSPTIFDVRARLVTVFSAAVAAAADEAVAAAEVVEGNRVRGTTPELFLLVGAVGGIGEDLSVLSDDRWGRLVSTPDPMSPAWRIQQGEIDCAAVAWAGDPKQLPLLRSRASAVVDACEAALIANPRLATAEDPALLDGENFAELTSAEVRDPHTTKGPYAEVTFTVSYRARAVFS